MKRPLPLLAEVCDEFIFSTIFAPWQNSDFKEKVPRRKHDCYQLLFENHRVFGA